MDFGKRLDDLIEHGGTTKKEVAKALDIAPNTLSGYIKNKRQPDLNTLIKIANYFNITTDYLLEHFTNDSSASENKLPAAQKKLNQIVSAMDAEHIELLALIASSMDKFDIRQK